MGSLKSADTLHDATAQRMATWARFAQAKATVRAAVSALGPEARAMPLKGVLLGALEIVHPAERPLRDVDLLVAGVNLGEAVARLGRAGFRITDLPWSHGYVSLSHPDHEVWLDLHSRPMPLGFGRLTRSYLFADAVADERLFGARVLVPTRHKIALQLIANIVKDRIVYAYPHAARDLAAVVASDVDVIQIASDLGSLSLRQGGTLAVAWAYRHTRDSRLLELFSSLEPRAEQREKLVASLHARVRSDRDDFWSRVKGRTGADNLVLRGAAPLLGALSIATYPLRRHWLLRRNRGDDVGELR